MSGVPDGPPLVPIPGRLERTLRLGPFPSARAALKFLAYAGAGAAVAAAGWAPIGAAVLGTGALFSLYRPGGEPLDAQLAVRCAFLVRRGGGAPSMTGRPTRRASARRFVTLADGRLASIVRAAGTPLAFLPPAELARRFDLYRELLNATEGDLWVLGTCSAIHLPSLLPSPGGRGPDGPARDGYRELVGLLVRRRNLRRIYLAVVSTGGRAEAAVRLEAVTDGVLSRLAGLDVHAERLEGHVLGTVAHRLGLGVPAGP